MSDLPAMSHPRRASISQASQTSQTAQDYINDQLQLEADAREALPYAFDTCTQPMGPLRQILFSCLTCNPPPSDPTAPYNAAGVCYSCSISCHGEHELVELFNKRNFACDCGTTRITADNPCTLRISATTGAKGDVKGEQPVAGNKYNSNFRNRFCGCGEVYDAHQERGTMFQCIGLGSIQEGGCGEDWWHPECLSGWPRKWYEQEKWKQHMAAAVKTEQKTLPVENGLTSITEEEGADTHTALEEQPSESTEPPLPSGFPAEEDFESVLCYKCVEAFPWVKRYASLKDAVVAAKITGSPSEERMPPAEEGGTVAQEKPLPVSDMDAAKLASNSSTLSLKRKADPETEHDSIPDLKRPRSEDDNPITTPQPPPNSNCRRLALVDQGSKKMTLFFKEGFRDHFCRCPDCFSLLAAHPHLLEEEETYEPPLSSASSEDGNNPNGGGSVGSKSLLDRGEAALSNVDRVRAIEGVMAYNHLKAGLKDFLKPFADSGQAVGAEDIKAYFEKLRGDAEGIKEAKEGASSAADTGPGDKRREQGGY